MKYIFFFLSLVLTTHFSMAQVNRTTLNTTVPTTQSTAANPKVKPVKADLTIAEFLETPQGLSLLAEQKADLGKIPPQTKLSVVTAKVGIFNNTDPKTKGKDADLTIAEFLKTPQGVSMKAEEKVVLSKLPPETKLLEAVVKQIEQDKANTTTTNQTSASRFGYSIPIIKYWDCIYLLANIGSSCNDNNPDTIFDTVQSNCTCVGTPWWYFLH